MKVLITGAAGFIGSHMAERMALSGSDVIGVDNLSDYYSRELKLSNVKCLNSKRIDFIEADLRYAADYGSFSSDFDYIFHFAAQPGLSETSSFQDYLSNNVVATNELINFARQCNRLQMFVNISTSSVYGLDATLDENAAPAPVSWYGVTKLAAEQLVIAESRKEILQACSLRLYSVYGPRERPDKLYPKLIRAALCDETFTLVEGSLQHKRSFSFVDDIIDGVASVIGREKIANNQVFNIGTDVQHTTAEGLAAVEALTAKKIQIELIPQRQGNQTNTNAVIDKAKKLLNYNPKTSLEEGIQKQINWFKENVSVVTHETD